MRHARAIVMYFLSVFGAGFVLGTLRVTLLVPRVGPRVAELLEMPLMLFVIVVAARSVLRRHAVPHSLAVQLAIGFGALLLLLAAELIMVVLLQSRAIADYIASRDPVSGTVYLLMLLVFALMPALLGSRRRS